MKKQLLRSSLEHFIGIFLIVMLLLAGTPAQRAAANTGTTRSVDGTNGVDAGNCTLVYCRTIAYAIGQSSGGDTIQIAAGIYFERITVNKSLTFTGSGMNTTILDGSSGGRVMEVPTGKTVAFNSLTIQHGSTTGGGGGIENYGTLSLYLVKVTNNTAAIGGGISSSGDLIMWDSAISGNNAVTGGGLALAGSNSLVTLMRVTISGNTASGYSGGLHDQTDNTVSGFLTLANVTISGNTANLNGAMTNTNHAVTLVDNSTFAGNSFSAAGANGGIANYASINFRNTIIADNRGTNCYEDSASIWISLGNNLDSRNDCLFTAPGDLHNTEPRLRLLADNGGPTQTMALSPRSPAINAGDDTTCNNGPVYGIDQRGVTRPVGAHCDMGAFEYNSTYTLAARDDFDGDGNTDPAKFISSAGSVWWLKSSTGLWDGKWLGSDTFAYAGASDYDGDGKTDPAKFYSATGTVWWVKSTTGLLDGQWLGPDTFTYISGSDFDGDGRSDPAKFYPATGTVWWVKSTTGILDGQWLGEDSFQYVSGSDFDGDGKTDPAKFYPATGTVWWVKSTTGTIDGMWLGSDTFTYVPASDFDGDGRTDPAKFYPATGTVWWVKSTTGTLDGAWLGPEAFTYVAGCDFDGDGKTDPAKYVASPHILSWLRSSTGLWGSVDLGTGTYTLALGQ